jgi:hypothetical protein
MVGACANVALDDARSFSKLETKRFGWLTTKVWQWQVRQRRVFLARIDTAHERGCSGRERLL